MAGQQYSYTTVVGGNCCFYGQVDLVIPQPGDNLLILDPCQCAQKVMGKLKAGETAVCGQVLAIDPATGELTVDDSDLTCIYGIAKEDVTAGADATPIVVYVTGAFDIDQVTSTANAPLPNPMLEKALRGVNIYLKKRQGA